MSNSSKNQYTDKRHVAAQDPKIKKRNKFLFIGILSITIIFTLVLSTGYILRYVVPQEKVIVQVGESKFKRSDMLKMLRVKQKNAEMIGSTIKSSEEIFKALQNMIENEIIDQVAPSLGISVSQDQLDIYIRDVFMPKYDSDESPDPVQIEREFREIFNNYLNSVGLTENEYRKFTRWSMLREQMRQFVGESVPTVAEQVYLHRLMVMPDDEIDIMKKKFNDGVPFEYIVREFSKDNEEVIRRGGEIGWVPKGIFPEYDYIIFDLEPNLLSLESQSIKNPPLLYFFMVSEKDPARKIAIAELEQLKTKALNDWLNTKRKEFNVKATFNSEVHGWLSKQLQVSSLEKPEEKKSRLQELGVLQGDE
ncbi:MAG: SurA N-terminal domain-containing protein [Dehalococcoidia bacterium]